MEVNLVKPSTSGYTQRADMPAQQGACGPDAGGGMVLSVPERSCCLEETSGGIGRA